MNGRIFVLLAATGLFVHVWNANHRPASPEAAAVSDLAPEMNVIAPRVELTLDLPPTVEIPLRETVPARVVAVETKREVDQQFPDKDLPFEKLYQPVVRTKAMPSVAPMWVEPALLPERLPQGIAAGLYQVVDNFGHVTLAQITSERLAEAGIIAESAVRDVYVQQSGNQRWYFIRQGEMCESKPTIAPAKPTPPLLTETTPAATSTTADTKEELSATIDTASLPMLFMKNRMIALQRERMIEATADKLKAAQMTVVAAVPKSARNLASTGWKNVQLTAKRVADRMLEQLPAADRIVWGIDWLTPKMEVLELPAVSVPGPDVELPAIPLQTVRETRSEETPR